MIAEALSLSALLLGVVLALLGARAQRQVDRLAARHSRRLDALSAVADRQEARLAQQGQLLGELARQHDRLTRMLGPAERRPN